MNPPEDHQYRTVFIFIDLSDSPDVTKMYVVELIEVDHTKGADRISDDLETISLSELYSIARLPGAQEIDSPSYRFCRKRLLENVLAGVISGVIVGAVLGFFTFYSLFSFSHLFTDFFT